jgi:hypothetical protein
LSLGCPATGHSAGSRDPEQIPRVIVTHRSEAQARLRVDHEVIAKCTGGPLRCQREVNAESPPASSYIRHDAPGIGYLLAERAVLVDDHQ